MLLTGLLPAVHSQTEPKDSPAPTYRITGLPLRPLAISNSDWVAGTTYDQHAATWNSKAGLKRISLPPEFSFSECIGINTRGEAVGTASTADSSRRVAFLLRQDKVVLLPGGQARANGINENGVAVGQAIPLDAKAAEPVLWKDGSLVDLKICCAGLARSINGEGQIVGDTYDKEGRYHVFIWDAIHGTQFPTVPDEQFSTALAINSRGEILLRATPGGLFVYAGGKLHPIDVPKGAPRAMNKDGVVVGSFGPNPDAQRAFVWDNAKGLRDLNTLIPAESGWKLEVATSINDRGEIVGWGDHGGADNVGFLLRLPATGNKFRPHPARTSH